MHHFDTEKQELAKVFLLELAKLREKVAKEKNYYLDGLSSE